MKLEYLKQFLVAEFCFLIHDKHSKHSETSYFTNFHCSKIFFELSTTIVDIVDIFGALSTSQVDNQIRRRKPC